VASRPFKARKSKLDAFADVVGVEPDARVAARANVSTETVRSFRVRRGIPALWRGEEVGPEASRIVRPAARRTKKRGKRAFQGRRSRLDSYLDLLGTVPDAEVAAMAGVTAQNVRSYRMRRGIEAAWRGVAKPQPVALPSARPAALAPAAKPLEVTRWAYRVTARVGADNREFVVFGESLSDAAIQAEGRLAERIPRARVLEIATLAEAL
jgi:hypothetical protein